jgi:hypothetical protein
LGHWAGAPNGCVRTLGATLNEATAAARMTPVIKRRTFKDR